MNRGSRLLLMALLAGLSAGLLIHLEGGPRLRSAAHALQPIGALWLAGLRMTLVPLVFSLVASAVNTMLGASAGGRAILVAVAVFGAMLVTAVILSFGATSAVLALWPSPPGSLAGLLHEVSAPVAVAPDLAAQVVALVPENPVAAAAQGQIAPLVVFALIFGWALSRLEPASRSSLAGVLTGVADAMMAIVRAVLAVAPIGVFALALQATLDAGLGFAALLVHVVGVLVVVTCVGIASLYGIAVVAGGVPLRRFARAAAAPQALAAGTCSSMATLPALLTAARDGLQMPPALAGAIVPLAVSAFRYGTAMTMTVSALVTAEAAGIHLAAAQLAIAALLILVTNSGVVGIPGAAVIYAADAPIFQALGLPLAFIPLLIAIFAIPDIFVTVCNVTADLAAAAVTRRLLEGRPAKEMIATGGSMSVPPIA